MRLIKMQLAAVLVAALLAPGCGGDDEKNSADGGSTETVAKTDKTAPKTEKTSTTRSDKGSRKRDGSAGAAPATSTEGASPKPIKPTKVKQTPYCERYLATLPQLSAAEKADLKATCEKAGKGDAAAQRRLAVKACVALARRSAPAGSARAQILAACENIAK